MPITGALETVKLINARPNGVRTTDQDHTDNWVYFTEGRVKFFDGDLKKEFTLTYVLEVSTTVNAVIGQTITGGTSTQTAVVVGISNNYLYVNTVSGIFTNGETITHTGYSATLTTQLGVGISGGKAAIKCTRATTSQFSAIPNKPLHAMFEAYISTDPTYQLQHAVKILDISGNKKIYIEIPENNVEDMSLNSDTSGLSIGELKSTTSYPTHTNYVPLWTVTSGAWETATDDREHYLIDGEYVDTSVLEAEITQQIQNGVNNYVVSTGAINYYEATYTPLPAAVTQSAVYYFKSHQTNTGTSFFTLNTVGGPVTAEVKKYHDQGLQADDIEIDQQMAVKYDGTYFQLITPTASANLAQTEQSLITGTVGEDVETGKIGFVGGGVVEKSKLQQTTGGYNLIVGDGINIRIQQGFIAQSDNILRAVTVHVKTNGTPVDTLQARIYEADQTTLVATSEQNILTISGTYVDYDFTFADVVLTEGTRYNIEIRRTGSQSGTNYYIVENYIGEELWEFGDTTIFDGSVYNYTAGSLYFVMQMAKDYTVGEWYLSDSYFSATGLCDGIFTETKNTGEDCLITVAGANGNQLALTPGLELFLNTDIVGDKQLVYDTTTYFGYDATDHEKIAQKFKINRSVQMSNILLRVQRNGSPSDNMLVRIETDNNDEPSGILVDPNAEATVVGSSLSNSFIRPLSFPFAGFFSLSQETDYWIVLTRDGAVSTTNYYSLSIRDGADDYPYGRLVKLNSGSRSNLSKDIFFDLLLQYDGKEELDPRNQETPFGGTTAQEKQSQSFIIDQDQDIAHIMLYLKKEGTPVDNVNVRIETDASGLPSGTLVDPNAIATFVGSDLTTTERRTYMDFIGSFSLTRNTRYWIVVERDGAIDLSNFYRVGETDAEFFYGNRANYNTSWSLLTTGRAFVYHFYDIYHPERGNITQFPDTYTDILTTQTHYAKVGTSISDTQIVIDKVVRLRNRGQTIQTDGTQYYCPNGGYVYGYVTASGASAMLMKLYLGDTPSTSIVYANTNDASGDLGISSYIPKGKYFSISITHNGSTTASYATFYML